MVKHVVIPQKVLQYFIAVILYRDINNHGHYHKSRIDGKSTQYNKS